ncbi:MAG: OmpA family protein, partial [Bacteroidales bacterium]|nr:OmpA family protein [Bacteroidales bacterium]
ALIDTINIMDSVWYHLAATYNRDTMKLYVNGAEVAKKPNDIAIQNEGSREFHIAQDGFGKRHFEGMMDEVRIWSVARSGQQIRDNMIKELNGKEDGLEGYWKFNKGSGFAAYDSSPNDNDGALSLPDWVNEYSYTWRGADGSFPVQEQEDISNLKAGAYTCMVTGGNGCPARITVPVREPKQLMLSEVESAHQNVTCNGENNGSLEVNPEGGWGSYEFSIDSGETWVTDSVFTGLAAGDYTVYLRDANDPACRYTGLETITITEPPALSMTEVADAHQDVTCNGGSNGLLEVDPLGGSGSYAFSIDSGGTWVSDSVFTGLSAGDYTVYLRDSNDTTCQYTGLGSITITEPTPLSMTEIDSAHQNVTSYRGADGTFEVDPSGGSGNYEFSIDSGSTWVSDSTFTALTAGNYTVYLRDANDTTCQFTGLGTISLTQPNPFSHCDSLQENNYCYRFWDESYDKIDSIPVRYEWSFSDGTKINGLKVQHCFPGAGKYSVKLNIIDNRTGNIFFTQKHYEFEIKDVVQPYIRSKDAFVEKEEMEFDGLKSNLPGFQIENYFWDFGDDTITKGPKVQHQYKKKGNYRVKLGLTGINDTTESKEYHCVWKEIKVFEDYQELAMHQENEEEKDSAIEPEEDPNNELQTEFNAYNRNPKEAIFRVEVFSSEEKVSLQDSIFDPLRDTYEISEFYDESDSLYSYTVGKRESLSATYPVYNDVVDRGFEQARVKSYIIGELPEKVVDHIKKAFNKIDNGHFGFDEYRVLESSYPVLDRIARILKHNPDIKIEIAAHTDNIGSFGYNMKLSKKRAQSIVDYMVSKGISKDRLRAVGYGESRPIATNQTKSGRQKNRRVEFILIRK